MPQAPNAEGHEWRFLEDNDDWPSQLVSSNDQGPPGNDSQENCSGTNNPRGANNVPSLGSHTTRHGTSQPKLFLRPISSHEDPAAGFSFTKAKPIQPLDFSRKVKQTIKSPVDNLPHVSPVVKERVPPQCSPHPLPGPSDIGDVVATSHQDKIALQDSPAVSKVLPVPFPNVQIPASNKQDPFAMKAYEAQCSTTLALSGLPDNAPATSVDDTLVGSGSDERCAPSEKPSVTHQVDCPLERPASDQHSGKVTRSLQTPLEYLTKPANQSCRTLPDTASGPPRAMKKRRRKLPANSSNNAATGLSMAPVYSEEELLHLLMIRHRHSQRERERYQVARHASEQQLQQLNDLANNLQFQLQEMQQRYEEKEAQVTTWNTAKPAWERKVKKLNDCLQGLMNDHNKLRDDARDLQDQSISMLKEREALVSVVEEVREYTNQQHHRSTQLVTEARHEVEMRDQTLKYQSSELRDMRELIRVERERNDRLEGEVSTIATIYGQLSEQLSGHRDKIMGNMSELLDKTESLRANAPPESHECLNPMLEECLVLLQKLRDASSTRPEDFDKLNDSMQGYLEGIVRCVEACEHSISTTEAGHQQLATLMQEQLRALSSNLTAEQNLSEQVMDLREVKATLRERLLATEMALREARVELVAVQRKDQDQSRKIIALEIETAKSQQPVDNTQLLLRLQETESRNMSLHREIDDMRTEATSLTALFQQRIKQAEHLDDRLVDTQVQLLEARQETEVVREEKLKMEMQALQQRESLEKELSQAASMELDKVKSEHLVQIQQLKSRKTPDDKLSHATKQCVMLRSEKDLLEKQVVQLRSSLDDMQKERQIETGFATRLNARVAELEGQVTERTIVITALRGELQATVADEGSKHEHVKTLQDHQSQRSNQAEKVEPSKSMPDSSTFEHFEKPLPAIIEDSQEKGTQPDVSQERSEHSPRFPNATSKVPKDFQSKSYTRSITPIDIVEDSQPITENDLMNFFPVTPLERTQTLKVSQVSVSRSRVTSSGRTERRGPQYPTPCQTMPLGQAEGMPTTNHDGMTRTQSSDGGELASTKSPLKSCHHQRPRQDIGNKPRGILKASSTKFKRDALEVDLNEKRSMAPPKRRKTSVAGLGPVINDSQSQSHFPSVKSRIQTSKVSRKVTRDEQMSRRFSQELRRSVEL